jgi:hypothetical protein
MKSSSHRLIPCFPFLLNYSVNCHLRRLSNSIPLLQNSDPRHADVSKLTQTIFFVLFMTLRHGKRRKHSLYYWKGVFTAPLYSNGSYSIVSCVFLATGMSFPSSCLAIDASSDFTIPAFGSHVTISASSTYRKELRIEQPRFDYRKKPLIFRSSSHNGRLWDKHYLM